MSAHAQRFYFLRRAFVENCLQSRQEAMDRPGGGGAGSSCNGRVKVLAQLIATVLGHGRCGKLASAPEMLAVVKRAASRVHGKTTTTAKKF